MKKILLSESIKRPPKPLTFETYLREQDQPVSSHPEAREPRIVSLVVFDYGSVIARFRQMRYVGKYLVASVKEMRKSAKSVLDNISCKVCIKKCPPKALYDTPIDHGTGQITYVSNELCFPYFCDYYGCSVCIAVCPFNNAPYDNLKEKFKGRNTK